MQRGFTRCVAPLCAPTPVFLPVLLFVRLSITRTECAFVHPGFISMSWCDINLQLNLVDNNKILEHTIDQQQQEKPFPIVHMLYFYLLCSQILVGWMSKTQFLLGPKHVLWWCQICFLFFCFFRLSNWNCPVKPHTELHSTPYRQAIAVWSQCKTTRTKQTKKNMNRKYLILQQRLIEICFSMFAFYSFFCFFSFVLFFVI